MYDAIHQFEPLMPSSPRQEALLAQAHALTKAALQLPRLGHVTTSLRSLLRGMNSYYTNRIEGQHTRPYEIEQALRQDFSADPKLAARQRLALAHIEAEEKTETLYANEGAAPSLYSADAVCTLHRLLFDQLPASERITEQGEPIEPGALRNRNVRVGQHVAPVHESLPIFLNRWAHVYGTVRPGEASLLALAAAHQRLGWIHPFIDGNGRIMRLHTHAMLHALGYTQGVWSPLRGFARTVDRYYTLLAEADEHRRGDLDGRGNLSEQALCNWIGYVLEVCLDQVRFMTDMLNVNRMEERISACLVWEEQTRKSGVRREALRPLHYLFISGAEMERGEFRRMTGLGDRTAGSLLAALLTRGFLVSNSPQGKLRFGLPLHALRFYFPSLWPEAEADAREWSDS